MNLLFSKIKGILGHHILALSSSFCNNNKKSEKENTILIVSKWHTLFSIDATVKQIKWTGLGHKSK